MGKGQSAAAELLVSAKGKRKPNAYAYRLLPIAYRLSE
jgi:hypothetical protein